MKLFQNEIAQRRCQHTTQRFRSRRAESGVHFTAKKNTFTQDTLVRFSVLSVELVVLPRQNKKLSFFGAGLTLVLSSGRPGTKLTLLKKLFPMFLMLFLLITNSFTHILGIHGQ